MAPPKMGDLQRRLGLKGAIIRFGEPWKTQEIKDLDEDIETFYRKYEPYLEREEAYPFEFDADISSILAQHGPRLWPDGPRDGDACRWLFPVGEVPEYPEDVYFSRHYDKLHSLFSSLMNMKVRVYRSNQRFKANRKKKEQEDAGAAAAAAAGGGALPSPLSPQDSELTEFDESGERPSLVHTIKFELDESKAKLQAILNNDEFNSRKRKVDADAPLDSIKRSKQTEMPMVENLHGYMQNMPTWTVTNREAIRAPSPGVPQTPAASGREQDLAPVVQAKEVSDSDDDASLLGRATLSVHSSDESSPITENHRQPDTPGDCFPRSTGMQYSLPEDTPARTLLGEGTQKPVQVQTSKAGYPALASPEGIPPVQNNAQRSASPQAVPGPSISKGRRRAKRSKTTLRPMINGETTDLFPAFSPRGSQSLSHIPSSANPQQDEHPVSIGDSNDSEKRQLKRRTHWGNDGAGSLNPLASGTSISTPAFQQSPFQQYPHATPPSISASYMHYTPHTIIRQPVQSSAASLANIASSMPPTQVDSPFVPTGPAVINDRPLLPSDDSTSAHIISTHFPKTFVQLMLMMEGSRSSVRMAKLGDCSNVGRLHQTVNDRFKTALQGRVASEVSFVLNNTCYTIDNDECGQELWDVFLKTLLDSYPSGSHIITAEIRT